MKQRPVTLSPRAALFIGAALLSTPALAQEQTVSPPPVVSTVTPAPAPAPQPRIVIAPQAPVVQAVPETAAPEAAPARTTARRAPTQTTRTTTATRAVTRAPAAAAPAPEPAPVAEQPAPETVAPLAETAVVEPAPAPEQAAPAEPVAPAQNAPIWPWALLGALVLAGAAIALMLRRRRTEDVVYEEPVHAAPVAAEPVPVAEEPRYIARPEVAPAAVAAAVAAEPVREPETVREPFVDAVSDPIETEAVVHDAEKADLAGVIDGDAPVAHRPWLEFGMRPVRAGTTEEEATVEIELTVGNTGDMPATNVHISTFMLTDAEGSEIEDLLLQHAHDDTVPPVSIPAGEGTRIDATLATPKGELGRTFNPIVIADARYTLPDGSEGRTAAAFRIGRPAVEEGLGAIGATRPHMVENVEAELERVLERA